VDERRWKITGLVAICILVAFGPAAIVWYVRTSDRGPVKDSPDNEFSAEIVPGDKGSKLCQLIVLRKRDNLKVGTTVCLMPQNEGARIVWLEDSSAAGYVSQSGRVLGMVRVKAAAMKLSSQELADLIQSAAK
jgi:hypothetical protein